MFKDPFFHWYNFQSKTGECVGITESIQYVVDFMNEHGPYDGVLGFSQGTIMARIILKLDEFKSKMPELVHGVPKFGIMFSGIFTERAKYIQEYEKDAFKLMVPYKQPIFWTYGEKDPLKPLCANAIVEEGNYVKVIHKYAHNIPKFAEMCEFINRMYREISDEDMALDFDRYDQSK
eukprot:CAMPEP_0168323214 /NCGR_PEP_ID=MMETSP0213-20121227/3353_1 /TAXON_ID=151035 /ORGANISM="Euplotes harpa, Strain FSP1.4" /LENGTH=176 /DNA_ID=CAMNT_0008325253 /DNA_START=185 /DNA_END=715 /DNA_ORIENTATION=+